MAKKLQLRRGTTSQHSSFTGAEGEVTVDTDKDVVVVHDGSTAGGKPMQAEDAELTELATMASGTASALADLTQAEVQILDGATVTTAELNLLDGVTATTAELNLLDGVTATTAELNYTDGVTSNIQTQLGTKAPSASPTFSGTVTSGGDILVGDTTAFANNAVTIDDGGYLFCNRSSGYGLILQNDGDGTGGDNKIALGVDGSATFSGLFTLDDTGANSGIQLGTGADFTIKRVAPAVRFNAGSDLDHYEFCIGGTEKISFNSDGGLTCAGAATFGSNIDLTDSTVDLYAQTTTAASKSFQLFSDIGGTKVEKAYITAAGAATFVGTVTSSAGVLGVGDAVLANDQTWTGAQRGTITALTDGATIGVDFNSSNNYSVTLAGNRTLGQPINQTAGQSGSIFVTQDGTGSRTLAYHADWKWAGGSAPTLSTAANAVDRIDYIVAASNKIHAVASLAVA